MSLGSEKSDNTGKASIGVNCLFLPFLALFRCFYATRVSNTSFLPFSPIWGIISGGFILKMILFHTKNDTRGFKYLILSIFPIWGTWFFVFFESMGIICYTWQAKCGINMRKMRILTYANTLISAFFIIFSFTRV